MRANAPPVRPLTRGGTVCFLIGLGALALLAAAAAWYSTSRLHWETTASGLRYRIVEAGEGPTAGPTDVASFNYTGRLLDGTVFDTNEGSPPAQMPVNQLVPGFAEALQLMNKGATFEIRVPPELGYGAQVPPGGPIPPNATLDFEITLVDRRPLSAEEVQRMHAMQAMQRQQMEEQLRQLEQGGGAAPREERPEADAGARPQRGR